MKKQYITPEIEVEIFSNTDIITTSFVGAVEYSDDPEDAIYYLNDF